MYHFPAGSGWESGPGSGSIYFLKNAVLVLGLGLARVRVRVDTNPNRSLTG